MKKILCILISLVLLILCGCSTGYSDDYSSVIEVIYDEQEETIMGESNNADNSSNQSVNNIQSSDIDSDVDEPSIESTTNNNAETEENILNLNDENVLKNIKLNGRCQKTTEGIGLNFSASAIEFNIDGGGAVIKIVAGLNVYFSIFVDDKLTEERKLIECGTNYVILARGLSQGSHNIRFVRECESRPSATATVVNVQLDDGKKLLPLYNEDVPLIECLGDSITSGYGNLIDKNAPNASDLKNQNSLRAYPYLLANELGLDYRIVSMSGIALGLRDGYPTFYDFYSAENYHKDPTQKYNSSNPQDVDIVMVNLGTNDASAGLLNDKDPSSVEEYAQRYTDLITGIGYRKDVKIVFVSGVMWCHSQTEAYKNAKTKLSALGYNNVYIHDVKTYNSGGGGHPSISEHELVAQELVKFFKDNSIA